MFKSLFFLVLGMLFFQNLKAQQDTLLYFFKNTGEIVADKTSADYFFVVTPPDQEDPNLFLVKAFYKDGSIRLIAKSTINTLPFNFQGPSIRYFVNGKKMIIRNYENGVLIGDVTSYYPNGKVYSIENNDNKKRFLKECCDSTGKVLCENGNGNWIKYDPDFQNKSEGIVVNGLETGEWRGVQGDSINYICNYKKGEVISGVGYYKGDKKYPFKKVEVDPDFGQGLDDFISFLHRKIIYPEYAKEHKLSGQVVVSFEIEKDGTIDDVKLLKGSALSLNYAVIDAVKLSPSWIPGKMYGVPVQMRRKVAIYFPF